jgi:hypothetical protein
MSKDLFITSSWFSATFFIGVLFLAQPIRAYFTSSRSAHLANIFTHNWESAALTLSLVEDGVTFPLAEYISNTTFQQNFAGWQHTGQVETIASVLPNGETSTGVVLREQAHISQQFRAAQPFHSLSFWIRYENSSATKNMVTEDSVVVAFDGTMLYRVSSAEVTNDAWHLISLPVRAQPGDHTITFTTALSVNEEIQLTGVSSARGIFSSLAQLIVETPDAQAIEVYASAGRFVPLDAHTLELVDPDQFIVPTSLSIYTIDATGYQSPQVHAELWFGADSIENNCVAQFFISPQEVHILIPGTTSYEWFRPVTVTSSIVGQTPFFDRDFAQISSYPVKRYSEPESFWIETETPLTLSDMFGNNCLLQLVEI